MVGEPVGLKLPNICLKGSSKTPKNLTQETCPGRGSKPGPQRDRRMLPPAPQRWNNNYVNYIKLFNIITREIYNSKLTNIRTVNYTK